MLPTFSAVFLTAPRSVRRKIRAVTAVSDLAFSFVIDNGANLGAEFFPHAVDYRILLGPAPPASVGRRRMWRRRLRHAPGNDSEPDWPSQHAAGRGGDQALCIRAQRHFNYRSRRRHL